MPDESKQACDFKTLAALSAKMVEASPDAKIAIDERGIMALVNAQTELLFGYARSELEGQKVEMLLPEAVRSVHERHRADFFADPRTREMGVGRVLKGRRRDGTEIMVQIKLAPLIVVGAGVFAMAVVRRIKQEPRPDAV